MLYSSFARSGNMGNLRQGHEIANNNMNPNLWVQSGRKGFGKSWSRWVEEIELNFATAHRIMDSGRYEEAEIALKKLLKTQAIISFGPLSEAATLNSLGVANWRMKRYEEALAYFERAHERSRSYGVTNIIYTADIAENIGLMLFALGKYVEAYERFQEAKEMKLQSFGPDNPQIADTARNLGDTCCKLGDIEQAIIHYREGLRISEANLGRDHVTTIGMMEDVAHAYQRMGQHKNALHLYENVANIKFRIKESVADTNYRMGVSLHSLGMSKQALTLFHQALTNLQIEGCGTINLLAHCLKNIGILHSEKHEYREAINFFMQALRIEFREFGLNHPNTVNTLSNMAAVYGRLGTLSGTESRKTCVGFNQAVLSILKRLGMQESMESADVRHNIATVLLMEGYQDVMEIRKHLRRSYRIYLGSVGEGDLKTRKVRDLLRALRNPVRKRGGIRKRRGNHLYQR